MAYYPSGNNGGGGGSSAGGLTRPQVQALIAAAVPQARELKAFITDAAGVQQGAALTYRSLDGDFDVKFPVTTAANQKPGFLLPAGRRLVAVYLNSARDNTADFAASPDNARRYVRNKGFRRADSTSEALIRTAAA